MRSKTGSMGSGILITLFALSSLLMVPCRGIAAEQLHVFVRGGDDAPWQLYWDESSWKGWYRFDGLINQAPALTSYDGQLHVFVRGGDYALYHMYYDGSKWNGWYRLGGYLAYAPTVVEYKGMLHVFVVGGDYALYQMYYDGSKWNGWYRLGGYIIGSPAAVSYGDTLQIFVTGGDRALYQTYWDGRWNGWYRFDSYLLTGPGAATFSPKGVSELHIFCVGGDSALYWMYWDGRKWSGWYRFDGVFYAKPAVTDYASKSQLHVFVTYSDRAIYQLIWDGSNFYGWYGFGAYSGSGPGAASYVPGGGPGVINRPPTVARLDATRVIHSFGRDHDYRSEGVAARPGFATHPEPPPNLSPLVAPRIITLDNDGDGEPDPNNAIVQAATVIPSGLTLLVAEGATDPDGNTVHFHWETVSGVFKGTYYSTGSEGSSFSYGQKITDLSSYDRNSIFMELPSIPFPVQNHLLMGGLTAQCVHVHDIPPPFPPEPDMSHTSSSVCVDLEYGRTMHLEIKWLETTTFPPNSDHDFPDGGFVMNYLAAISGNGFAASTQTVFRIDCGGSKRIPNRTLFDQSITVSGGRFTCRYGKDEEGSMATPTVVASTSGTYTGPAATAPFIFPINNSLSVMDTFRSRGCTVGDVEVQVIKAGVCKDPFIDVWDSGVVFDDAFDLIVDGANLGRTQPGGNKSFSPVLLSGTHNLGIVYVYCGGLSGCSGPGTFSVRLNCGATFVGGGDVQIGTLPPNDAVPAPPYAQANYPFNVP